MIRIARILLSISVLMMSTAVLPQNLTRYFELMEEGKLSEVRSDIDQLLDQFPNHAGVMFLSALTQERAEDAVMAYKKLIQNHPNSKYADDAMMKVGEYLYARGLYTQASAQIAKVPRVYPRSEHVQRAIDLQINSLLAIGEKDSIASYVATYQKDFPALDFNYNLESGEPLVNRPVEIVAGKESSGELSSAVVTPSPSLAKMSENLSKEVTVATPRPFVVQVGAYGSEVNALRQKQRLEQAGYEVEIWPISVGGNQLQAVQIVRFESRKEATQIGDRLKKNFGFNYMVTKREE